MARFVARLMVGAILLLLNVQAIAQSETRVALIIANGAYANVSRLPNPTRDGQLVAQSLRRAGFATVEVSQDLSKSAFDQALLNFRRLADNSDVALIYFAGHGLEVDGINWLLPTDARLQQAADIHLEAVSLDNMLRIVGGARRLRVVVLDACRNNPFAQRLANGRAVMRGLSPVEGLPRGTLVAYSASSGQVAADGEAGSNSPFAVALADRLVQPGLEIRFLFAHVRDDVLAANPQGQEPWLGFSLSAEEFFFIPGSRQSAVASDQGAEVAAFNLATQTWTVEGWQDYLRSYPSGRYVQLAEVALAGITRPGGTVRPRSDMLEAARSAVRSLTPHQIDAVDSGTLVSQVVGASSRDSLELLAADGDAVAQFLAGSGYALGIGGFPQSPVDAVRLLTLSANSGFARAQVGLGTSYYYGRGGLPVDYLQALRWYRLAAVQNSAQAMGAMGFVYLYGLGVASDPAQARQLFETAAARGSVRASAALGLMHENGWGGLTRNPTEAVRLYRAAAAMGDTDALTALGELYSRGEGGLERNAVEAARLFRLAANAGGSRGQAQLGFLFSTGAGGLVRDELEAVRLFRLSAAQNDAEGQRFLGFYYERGLGGLTRDLAEAERLYRLAAAQGNEQAQAALRELGGRR